MKSSALVEASAHSENAQRPFGAKGSNAASGAENQQNTYQTIPNITNLITKRASEQVQLQIMKSLMESNAETIQQMIAALSELLKKGKVAVDVTYWTEPWYFQPWLV